MAAELYKTTQLLLISGLAKLVNLRNMLLLNKS